MMDRLGEADGSWMQVTLHSIRTRSIPISISRYADDSEVVRTYNYDLIGTYYTIEQIYEIIQNVISYPI